MPTHFFMFRAHLAYRAITNKDRLYVLSLSLDQPLSREEVMKHFISMCGKKALILINKEMTSSKEKVERDIVGIGRCWVNVDRVMTLRKKNIGGIP